MTQPNKSMTTEHLFLNKGVLYEEIDHGLFIQAKEMEIKEKQPMNRWKGGRISYQTWGQIVAFLLWSQKAFKSEAMITLFYNQETKEWRAHPFPQETKGMSVSMKNDSEEFKEQRKMFPHPWLELGSVHHHCTMKAFASGTDDEDERDRDGIHITLGEMEKEALDIHSRATFHRDTQPTNIPDWIEPPDWVEAIPVDSVRMAGYKAALLEVSLFKEATFPNEWKGNVREKSYGFQKKRNRTLEMDLVVEQEIRKILEKYSIHPTYLKFVMSWQEEGYTVPQYDQKVDDCLDELQMALGMMPLGELEEYLENMA